MSDPDTELIPEETYIAVDPIPTDVERPIVIFFDELHFELYYL